MAAEPVRLERLLALWVTVLRLPPESFWRASLREFIAIFAGLDPPAAPARAHFQALMRRFPDQPPAKEEPA